MKYFTFLLCFLFFSASVYSSPDFKAVDKHALNAPRNISKDISKLTEYLVHDYKTDLEKVRSFYIWIAHNIAYDDSAYSNNRKRINRSNVDILDRRQAVCFGYTTLFKEMCERSKISCFIVNGYAKNQTTGAVDLTSANHAWNAVLIDSTWQLMDITWGSGNDQEELEKYFLTAPDQLIYSHLPADPMWQLINCPIQPGVFRKADGFITAMLKDTSVCFSFQDSINAYLNLPPFEQNIKSSITAYHFNPVTENKEELGHTYMDYVSILSNRVEALEMTDSIEAIKAIHLQIIATCAEANQLIDLYDHQKENLAYSHFNYAIALSKDLPGHQEPQLVLDDMLLHFETAKGMLEGLPRNFVIENALGQIGEYVEWVRTY